MRKIGRNISTVLLLVIAALSLITDWYEFLVIAIASVMLIVLIDKMGKGIVLRESTAMLYIITCLVMPLVGYHFYTYNNPLARLWVKYMQVPEDVYFRFALPAISLFCLALTWPLSFRQPEDEGETLHGNISRIKQVVTGKKNTGIVIMITGVLIGIISKYLPGGLQFFATLFFFGSFAGLLYVYFAPSFRYKKAVIAIFALFIAGNAVRSGMFTVVAYMGITIYSFFLLGNPPGFWKKVSILVLSFGFLIVLQNVKLAFRQSTWQSGFKGNKLELFGKLFIENLQRGDVLLQNEAFFNIYVRANQGFNISLVMNRFPSLYPHDNGGNLAKSFASALVPRFLWPDKPEAGGKFNMKYYAGITLRGWSTNVGPLGEAYGSFGVAGGIIYMFFLGLFIRWAFKKVFIVGKKMPLVICWIPVLFYQVTYSSETDTLQILNSLFKSALFLWILYKTIPVWLVVAKRVRKLKTTTRSSGIPSQESGAFQYPR